MDVETLGRISVPNSNLSTPSPGPDSNHTLLLLLPLQDYFFLDKLVYDPKAFMFWYSKHNYNRYPDRYFAIGLCLHLSPLAAALVYALYALIQTRGRCYVSVK